MINLTGRQQAVEAYNKLATKHNVLVCFVGDDVDVIAAAMDGLINSDQARKNHGKQVYFYHRDAVTIFSVKAIDKVEDIVALGDAYEAVAATDDDIEDDDDLDEEDDDNDDD